MLTPTDFHLALEAVVAYVDRELSPAAEARAATHIHSCPQCSADVAEQRAAKAFLTSAAGPALPPSLLDRLQQIPFSTELEPPGMTLALHGEDLLWSRGTAMPPPATPVSAAPAGAAPPDRRVPGRPETTTRPQNRRPGRSSVKMRRLRRGLIGAVAGLAAGVLATSVAPAAVSGVGTQSPLVQERSVVPDTPAALFDTLDDAIAPRQFSGAATGRR